MVLEALCFGYEVDMLRGRMATLGEHVDTLVVVESDKTHTGRPKGYLLPEVLPTLPHADRIDYHQITGLDTGNAWTNERFHRNALGTALAGLQPADDDLVLICDVDEWWEPEHLPLLGPDLTVMDMRKHHFSVRWFDKMELAGMAASWDEWQRWDIYSTKIAVCEARGGRAAPGRVVTTGWHFSSIGNEADVMRKVGSFSHAEFDTLPMRAAIQDCYRTGHDLQGHYFTEQPLDGLPAWIADGHAPASWYRTRSAR